MSTTHPRAPIVAIMGHIDHGKSTLLDYIRHTNKVATEAGGITQHISAYEIEHEVSKGITKKITFLDTPGHAAFTCMRECGVVAADIAILVVSAEDGVKTQTLEALRTIVEAKIPYIVAINKIDRPNANIEKTKLSLADNGILVEGYGGTISWVPISAKVGTGVLELLETILLVAEMENISTDDSKLAEGVLIESHHDPKRGITGTILLKNGTLTKGQFVVVGNALTTTRIIENYLGKQIDAAYGGMPIQLVGFNSLPKTGLAIRTFTNKKDAEEYIKEHTHDTLICSDNVYDANAKVIPIIVKADVYGTAEAIEQELGKIIVSDIRIKIIEKGIGSISESDIARALSDKETIVIGFHVGADAQARDLAEKNAITIKSFDIIYKLTEWISEELEVRRPRKEVRESLGKAKVLKIFSQTKEKYVIGCHVSEGMLLDGSRVSILRRDFEIAEGKIIGLQQAKQSVKEVLDGDCGVLIETKIDIAPGDVLEAFTFVTK